MISADMGTWLDAHQQQIFESTVQGEFLAVNHGTGCASHINALGFRLEKQADGACTSMGLDLANYGREGNMRAWTAHKHQLFEHEIRFFGPGLDLQYLHSVEGLRQNFLVGQSPSGCGPLTIELNSSGELAPLNSADGTVVFADPDGTALFTYSDLRVWDDCGRRLNASMSVIEHVGIVRIEVDDNGAQYPLLIDPVATAPNATLASPLGSALFGSAVRTAGDLNGDGFSDVVIGAPNGAMGETNEGVVYVFYGSATGIPTTASVTLQSNQVSAAFGYSVGTAGDVNGDGYGDLLVGASSWEDLAATNEEGGVFVYHGSAAGISTVPNIILQSNAALIYFGYSVSCAGDINNDGYSDIIVGAPYAALPTSLEGAAYVFLGSAAGLTNTYHKRLERNQGAAQFGHAIAGIGDVNADGYSDIAVSAFRFDNTPTVDDGIVCIYYGSAVGIAGAANPAPGLIITATGYTSNIGWSVGPAGDVNGDGYSDMVVGDWRATVASLSNAGGMFVYHGSATGLSPTPATLYHFPTANTLYGRSVFTAGDVNGDNYADIIVGAATFTAGHTSEGAAFVYLGSPTGITLPHLVRYEPNIAGANMGECVSTAGDVNGDGYSDMIVGIKLYLSNGGATSYHGGTYTLATSITYTRASGLLSARLGTSVANAGDVNGDGYSDVLAGAPGASNGQAGEGLVYVHYGSSTGLSAAPNLTLERNVAGAAFGSSVASAGDVNGDGYADVVIGAPFSSNGQAFVYMGSAAGLATVPAVVMNGTAGSEFGKSVFTAGDVNSDGYAEVIVGAPGIATAYVWAGQSTGLITPAMFTLTGPMGSRFGASVGTAGDVNGTGYSSVIVGAPQYSNGQVNEGAAYIFHGSTVGVVTPAATLIESNNTSAFFGTAVAGAGDVNGNGYYDVVIGAPNWASGQTNEGGGFIYYGAPAGIQTVGYTLAQSNIVGALLGSSVSEAGDVNGDGYADVLFGAPYLTSGQVEEGRILLMHGAPTGTVGSTIMETNVVGTRMGWSVAGGGDVDGDGFSDVLAGGPNAAPSLLDEGALYMMRGNQGRAFPQLSRQYRANLVSPLSTNSVDFADMLNFGIGHFSKDPIQRTLGRLRWEVVFEGQPFSGNPITNSVASTGTAATWTDLGLLGVELKQLVAKAPTHLRYKWRLRVEYALNKLINGQRFSRWYYGYASGVGDIGILPVELVSFRGAAERDGNRLWWTTGSEQGSGRFIVERSIDGDVYDTIGEVRAAGESQSPIDYEWFDDTAPTGTNYYRLRMIDSSGEEDLSEVVIITRATADVVVLPNPAFDRISWQSVDVAAQWRIIDALGKTVLAGKLAEDEVGSAWISNLPEGCYSLEVTSTNGNSLLRSRFVKAQAPMVR
jgi:FG-GAP repeat/FG-GAP-like repeat